MPETSAEKRRVLITGVTAPLARQLAEELLLDPRVEKIVGVDVVEEPYYFRDVDHSRFLYKRADALKGRELHNLFLADDFQAAQVNTVVHAPLFPEERRTLTGAVTSRSPCVQSLKLLLEQCQASTTVRRVVFLSSYLVYAIRPGSGAYLDEGADLNFDPEAPARVQDRVDADMLCRAQGDGLQVAVLRPAPIIGRNVDGPLNHYLQAPFCPTPMGFDPIVNPIHARDVMRALQLLLHSDATGAFNVAGKEVAPLSFFIRMAGGARVPVPGPLLGATSRLLRLIRASRFDPREAGTLLRDACILDTRRAREALGFEPHYHIKF
jgi:UDP-glucose 4-epimerase